MGRVTYFQALVEGPRDSLAICQSTNQILRTFFSCSLLASLCNSELLGIVEDGCSACVIVSYFKQLSKCSKMTMHLKQPLGRKSRLLIFRGGCIFIMYGRRLMMELFTGLVDPSLSVYGR